MTDITQPENNSSETSRGREGGGVLSSLFGFDKVAMNSTVADEFWGVEGSG
jgi:hypothetical protein